MLQPAMIRRRPAQQAEGRIARGHGFRPGPSIQADALDDSFCGYSSAVERHLAKVDVVSSILIARSNHIRPLLPGAARQEPEAGSKPVEGKHRGPIVAKGEAASATPPLTQPPPRAA